MASSEDVEGISEVVVVGDSSKEKKSSSSLPMDAKRASSLSSFIPSYPMTFAMYVGSGSSLDDFIVVVTVMSAASQSTTFSHRIRVVVDQLVVGLVCTWVLLMNSVHSLPVCNVVQALTVG